MAHLKEDRIDFTKLEKELTAAIDADASYWRVNGAKIRAMEQRVETYDQFRDLVAAAHIKPLEKKDKISQSKRHQPWNPFSSSNSTTSSSTSPQETGDQVQSSITKVKIPKNGHEFTKEWRNRKKTSGSCYSYMLDLGGDTLAKIFRAEISFGLLGEIITTLNDHAEEKHCGKIADILVCLTRAGRFSLSLDFLNKSEKQALSELMGKLEQWRQAVDRTEEDSVAAEENEEGTKSEDCKKERLEGDKREEGEQEEGTVEIAQESGAQFSSEDIVKLKELYKLSEK
eukprot:XP_796005.3 PREDICTED: coiled-coil domain-containing protein 103 [Strongylocentrotus purpuratus]